MVTRHAISQIICTAILTLAVFLFPAKSFAEEEAKPLRVYILVGQSNMVGTGAISSIDYVSDDPATSALHKKLEPVGLTEDQVNKIKEMGAKLQAEFKVVYEAAGITREVQAKLAAAQKSVKDSELKGKERLDAIHKSAGINEKQSEAIKKTNEIRGKLKKEVLAMLTDAQKEKLPVAMKPAAMKPAAKKKKKEAP